jgi:hypothetical protein
MIFLVHIIFNHVLAMHLVVPNVSLCAVVTVTISVNLCAVLNKDCFVLLHSETEKCDWYKGHRKPSEP